MILQQLCSGLVVFSHLRRGVVHSQGGVHNVVLSVILVPIGVLSDQVVAHGESGLVLVLLGDQGAKEIAATRWSRSMTLT